MNIVLYTAIYGNKNILHDNHYFSKNIDYICFTDNKHLKSNFWKIIVNEPINKDFVRSAKIYKILPHRYFDKYDFSIWIDGNINIISDINELINFYNYDLCLYNHNDESIEDKRNCVYEELKACIKYKKYNIDAMNRQIEKYKKEKYPKNNGLICGGVILRKHKNTIKIMEDWWQEIINGSPRDQLSLNYVCWKNNFKINYIKGNIRNNTFFKLKKHNK
jgi:hypothetical protein